MSRANYFALFFILILCAIGLSLAALLLLHESDPAALGLVCGPAGSCDRVLTSKFSHFAGIPLAAFGAAFYAAIIILWACLLGTSAGKIRGIGLLAGLLLACVAALISLALLGIQFHFIAAFCLLCCISAIDCLLLFALFFYLHAHDDFAPQPLASASAILLLIAITIFTFLAYFLPAHGIVARVGTHTITNADMQSALGKPLRNLQWQTYRMQHDWLSKQLEDIVLDSEAANQGIPKPELLRRNVDQTVDDKFNHFILARVPTPSDAEIAAFRQQIYPHLHDQTYAIYIRDLLIKYNATDYLALPAITEDDLALIPGPHRGADPKTAPARLVIFSDFGCEYCAQMAPSLNHLVQQFGSQISLTFRYFPHDLHEHSKEAAIAAECANRQGKFWPYNDALMQHGGNLDEVNFTVLAEQLGLNMTDFLTCRDDPATSQAIESSRAQALAMGLDNTPAVFLNGKRIGGYVSEPDLARQIRACIPKK